MSDELPAAWTKVQLQQVSEFVPTGVLKFNGEAEYFSTGSIQLDRFEPEGRFSFYTRPARANRWSRKGDVLQARMQGTNKGFLISQQYSGRLFSSGFLQLRPHAEYCDAQYLAHYVRSPQFLSERDELATGSTQVALTDAGAIKLTFPLAPLAEQKRIVAKLEKLMGKVDISRARLEKVSAILKRFRQSILAAACSGCLTADWSGDKESDNTNNSEESPDGFPDLPRSWRWAGLEEICETIVDCPHSTPKWTSSGRLCVRTTNFKPGILDLSEVRYVSNATFNERIERLRPQAGDILYSREGGILGIACMIPPEVELCLGQRMMLLRTKKTYVPTFLMHWLNCPLILRRVRELTGGSAAPHLNVKDIKCFPTPVPPPPEQQEIVRRVEELFALADRLEARVGKARGQVDKLTQAILAKAFRGELVPQDPNDEPTEKLLARIRAATGPVAVQGGKVASSVSVRRGRPRKVR